MLAVRNLTKGEVVRRELLAIDSSVDLQVAQLDLLDLESIRRFAEPWRAGHRSLDLLVNNAGIGASQHSLSPQEIKSSWATNVVGRFALTGLQLDRLTADARIVHVGQMLSAEPSASR